MTASQLAPSNSVFFTVTPAEPLQGAGFEVRVMHYRDPTLLVAVITDFIDLTFSPELSGPGAGSITLDRDSPFWDVLLPDGTSPTSSLLQHEYIWQVVEDGLIRFEFLGRETTFTHVDEGMNPTIVISGPGLADALTWPKILRPGWPKPIPANIKPETATGTDSKPSYNWQFPVSFSAMHMFYNLLRSAQARGVAPWIKTTFNAAKDSAGNAWRYVPAVVAEEGKPHLGYKPTAGQNLLDFLSECTGQDPAKLFAERYEWIMWPGAKLDVRPKIGVDRTNTVRFFVEDLTALSFTRQMEDVANYIVVVDNIGKTSAASDRDSVNTFGRRELLDTQHGEVRNKARRDQLARYLLDKHRLHRTQWNLDVAYDEPGRRPFRDYQIGDWIGVVTQGRTGIGLDYLAKFRVVAITVKVARDRVDVELTLDTYLQMRQKALEHVVHRLMLIANQDLSKMPGVNVDSKPTDATKPFVYDPDKGFTIGEWQGGGGGGPKVFIQSSEPTGAVDGDFWLELY